MPWLRVKDEASSVEEAFCNEPRYLPVVSNMSQGFAGSISVLIVSTASGSEVRIADISTLEPSGICMSRVSVL